MIWALFYLQYKPYYPHYTDEKTEAGGEVNCPRGSIFNQYNLSANPLVLIVFLSISQKRIQSVVIMVMQGIVYRLAGIYIYTHTYSYTFKRLQKKAEY